MSLKQEIMVTRLQECAGRGFTLERERRVALSRRLPAFRDDVLVQRGQAGTSPPPRSSCPTQCPPEPDDSQDALHEINPGCNRPLSSGH